MFVVDTRNSRVRNIAAGMIRTIVGSATAGFSGDGGSATAAQLNLPTACIIDGVGNLYIADAGNNRVRLVTLFTDVITTFAGNGVAGFAGDGGPATAAALNSPFGLALSPNDGVTPPDWLYIADTANSRVRVVSTAGLISTFAGNGNAGFSGDGGPATAASLNGPSGVAFTTDDAGGTVLVIADTANSRLRGVSLRSHVISTLGGTGVAGYSGDGGPPTSAMFNNPVGVAVGGGGAVFVGDAANNRVRVIRRAAPSASPTPSPRPIGPGTWWINTTAGNGTQGQGGGGGDGGPATSVALNTPGAVLDLRSKVFLGREGGFLIADTGVHVVRFIDSRGECGRGEV